MVQKPGLFFRVSLLLTVLAACGEKGFDRPRWAGGTPPPPLDRRGMQNKDIRASYVVQRGDTIYALAREFKVPVKSLIDVNDLQPPYQLLIGQRLSVPTGPTHTVAAGETLYAISRRYNVDSASLARANELSEPYTIKVGQFLRLPGSIAETNPDPAPSMTVPQAVSVVNRAGEVKMVPLPPPPKPIDAQPPSSPEEPAAPGLLPPTLAEPEKPVELSKPTRAQPALPDQVAPAKPSEDDIGKPATPVPALEAPVKKPSRDEVIAALPSPPPRGGRSFQWPVSGRIVATFGPQGKGLHNDGINVAAAKGAPVRAAENGIVAYAGSEIRGFGNLLLIRHADGYMTAYAHNEVLLVNRGDTVRRGQVIARVGQTGSVTSPQLHFEIRKGTQAVDPEQFLDRPTANSEPSG